MRTGLISVSRSRLWVAALCIWLLLTGSSCLRGQDAGTPTPNATDDRPRLEHQTERVTDYGLPNDAAVAVSGKPGPPPSAMVQVAPGVSLPASGSVWVVDDADLTAPPIQLYRVPVIVDRHLGKNTAGALAGSFFYRPSMSIEIQGANAVTRLREQKPVFYVRQAASSEGVDDVRPGTTNDNLLSDLTLVRLKSLKEKRIEEYISTNAFGTGAKRKLNQVALMRKTLDGGWITLTPAASLEPGEYVLVPVPRTAAYFNEYAYDFGIDAAKVAP